MINFLTVIGTVMALVIVAIHVGAFIAISMAYSPRDAVKSFYNFYRSNFGRVKVGQIYLNNRYAKYDDPWCSRFYNAPLFMNEIDELVIVEDMKSGWVKLKYINLFGSRDIYRSIIKMPKNELRTDYTKVTKAQYNNIKLEFEKLEKDEKQEHEW